MYHAPTTLFGCQTALIISQTTLPASQRGFNNPPGNVVYLSGSSARLSQNPPCLPERVHSLPNNPLYLPKRVHYLSNNSLHLPNNAVRLPSIFA
jgi:hypothetical protein